MAINLRTAGILLAGLAYPPGVYYGIRTFDAPAPISVEIPRDAGTLKDCGGISVPQTMPCPAPVSGIGRISGRFIAPQTSEPLSIYTDSGKTPGLIFSGDGVAHFPRGLNVDNVFSGGEALISGRTWRGDPTGLVGPQGPKGDAGAPGAPGAKGDAGQGCTVTKSGKTATINCANGAGATIIDGSDGAAGRDCSGDSGCIQAVKDAVLADSQMVNIIKFGKIIVPFSDRNLVATNTCKLNGKRCRTIGYYDVSGPIIYKTPCVDCAANGFPDASSSACSSSGGDGGGL